jgi:hypothetical protein
MCLFVLVYFDWRWRSLFRLAMLAQTKKWNLAPISTILTPIDKECQKG